MVVAVIHRIMVVAVLHRVMVVAVLHKILAVAVLPRPMVVVQTSTCNHNTRTGSNMDLPKAMSNNMLLLKAEATAAITKGVEPI